MNKFLGLVALVAAAVVVPANATVVYDLTSNHCGVPADCGAPGTIFGNVSLDQNGTTVDFTVHLNNPPYVYAQTGSVDFQVQRDRRGPRGYHSQSNRRGSNPCRGGRDF